MSIKDDISKMLEEAWNDQTVGEAFQSQVRGMVSYELNHRVRMVMQRMTEDAVIRDIVRPYIEQRVKALEPEIKASIDRRLLKVLDHIKTKLPVFIFEATKQYTQSWMTEASRQLANHLEAAISWSFFKQEDEEKATEAEVDHQRLVDMTSGKEAP